jgi:putative restriction endonuclease
MPTWGQFIAGVKVWKSGTEVAIHKPLLLLAILARASKGDSTRFLFKDLVEELEKALREFGPDRVSLHAEYPFWHLQDENFWVIDNKDGIPLSLGSSGPTKKALLDHKAVAVVPQPAWDTLSADPGFVEQLVTGILTNYWPDHSLHGQIRQHFGLKDCGSCGE